MKRLPSLFRRTPPSPRTPSVTRMPRTLGGHTMPVGWNCTNSMSCRTAPAWYASDWPSPVYSQLVLVLRHGAIVRLNEALEPGEVARPLPHKAERVAMEEVRRNLVLYEVPAPPKA